MSKIKRRAMPPGGISESERRAEVNRQTLKLTSGKHRKTALTRIEIIFPGDPLVGSCTISAQHDINAASARLWQLQSQR